MRLDKFISNNTPASRSEVKRLVRSGAVTVNGTAVTNSAMTVATTDHVVIDGLPVAAQQPVYYMLNKPAGYVCTNSDAQYPTVLDLLPAHAAPAGSAELQIAGRLDVDTTGLVLITSDGQWNHRVTSPRFSCGKVYRVTLEAPFDPATHVHFAEGMLLNNESKATRPAQVRVLDQHTVLLTLFEGKYHQVKRMFAATGNRVLALHRQSVGTICLTPELEAGQWRPLTAEEIASADDSQGTP